VNIFVEQPSQAAHSLGIASLVVSIVSLLTCWLPLIGGVISGLGFLLGLAGLIVAMVRRGSGVGFAIAGTTLSALSLFICLVWTFAIHSAFTNAFNSASRFGHDNENVNQQVIASGAGNAQDKGANTVVDAEWADASRSSVRQNALSINVKKVAIGKVPLLDSGNEATSKDELLTIRLELLNTDPSKKLDYRTWAGQDFSFDRDYATLRDNFGNIYKRIDFGLGSFPVDGVKGIKALYPNKKVTDVLVFETPLDTIEYLRLELPAKNFGGTGMLRFQIPKAMINK
jgi:hypothetical protein